MNTYIQPYMQANIQLVIEASMQAGRQAVVYAGRQTYRQAYSQSLLLGCHHLCTIDTLSVIHIVDFAHTRIGWLAEQTKKVIYFSYIMAVI